MLPGDGLALRQIGRDVGEARVGKLAAHGAVLQIVHARGRLAGTSMRHKTGEAFGALVEWNELKAWAVWKKKLCHTKKPKKVKRETPTTLDAGRGQADFMVPGGVVNGSHFRAILRGSFQTGMTIVLLDQ